MALLFELPNAAGPLKQGEILRAIWEHRPVLPPFELEEDAEVGIDSTSHPFVVAMTPDCDLYQDFCARYPDRGNFPNPEVETKFREAPERYMLTHAIFCDALREDELIGGIAGGDIMRRVRQNQDERYHHLGPAPIENDDGPVLDVFLDFKKVFALPLDVLYGGIVDNGELRLAVVPAVYLHDLIHRFYGFQSRIALPD